MNSDKNKLWLKDENSYRFSDRNGKNNDTIGRYVNMIDQPGDTINKIENYAATHFSNPISSIRIQER